MTHILFVALNARFTHSNPALYYLREALHDLPVTANIRQWTIHDSQEIILERVSALHPEVLALSVYIWNADFIATLLPNLKALFPEITVVIGGPEVTFNLNKWRALPVDYIIPGPGEAGIRAFAEAGSKWPEQMIIVPPQPFPDVRFPYRREDFLPATDEDSTDRTLDQRYVYYEASRGCPFGCTYCHSGGTRLERRDLPTVFHELDFLVEVGVPLVKFVDRSFNADRKFARAIWRHLLDQPKTTRFHFELYPALLEDEDFALIAEAPEGKFHFEVGVQAIQTHLLRRIGRHETWTEVEPKLRRLTALHNVTVHLDMLVGLPEQTDMDAAATFDALSALDAEHLQIGLLKCLPGTPLSEEKGLVALQQPPYLVMRTDWMTMDELSRWRHLANLHEYLANTANFTRTMHEAMARFTSATIFWRDLLDYWQRMHYSLENRSWPTLGERLQGFLQATFPTEIAFFDDCLRWDWCGIAARDRLPSFLEYSGSRADHSRSLKQMPELPSDVLSRTVFFRAQSATFPERWVAMIPHGRGKKEIRVLNSGRLYA